MLANRLKKSFPSGGPIYVDDVFSTYIYTSNGGSQTVTNGIDLANNDGMVWLKNRDSTGDHIVINTDQGYSNSLSTNTTEAGHSPYHAITEFHEDGFLLDSAQSVNGDSFVSWTFRKQAGFFDVVTYTGDGVTGRQIPHSLGCDIGMIIIKRTDSTSAWLAAHYGSGSEVILALNSTGSGFTGYNYITPSSTYFKVNSLSPFHFGGYGSISINDVGAKYVAYIFAHNDNDGSFGENGDESIIKCGSYIGNGNTNGPEIDLGFEPQYFLYKNISSTSDWSVFDTMRGFTTSGSEDSHLYPNNTNIEWNADRVNITNKGLKITGTGNRINTNGYTYIYIAIARPHKPAESGSEVFSIDTRDSQFPSFNSYFPVDLSIKKDTTGGSTTWSSRLTQGYFIASDSTGSQVADSRYSFDYSDGYYEDTPDRVSDLSWMFRRSRGFFDIVVNNPSVEQGLYNTPHNLGAIPELVISKSRETSNEWWVYTNALSGGSLALDSSRANGSPNMWGPMTDTTLGNYMSTRNMVYYLFATKEGISKVGSFTGNGTSQIIDCGFSAGARFILIKRTDLAGDWYLWDSTRGIVAGDDPHLSLNTTAAQVSSDSVDPHDSGFTINQNTTTNINVNGGSYIFLAVA